MGHTSGVSFLEVLLAVARSLASRAASLVAPRCFGVAGGYAEDVGGVLRGDIDVRGLKPATTRGFWGLKFATTCGFRSDWVWFVTFVFHFGLHFGFGDFDVLDDVGEIAANLLKELE